jgi:hypothetical protein
MFRIGCSHSEKMRKRETESRRKKKGRKGKKGTESMWSHVLAIYCYTE